MLPPTIKNILMIVQVYNKTRGGFDRVDQRIADCPVTRNRGKRYYKKIFFHLLERAE